MEALLHFGFMSIPAREIFERRIQDRIVVSEKVEKDPGFGGRSEGGIPLKYTLELANDRRPGFAAESMEEVIRNESIHTGVTLRMGTSINEGESEATERTRASASSSRDAMRTAGTP